FLVHPAGRPMDRAAVHHRLHRRRGGGAGRGAGAHGLQPRRPGAGHGVHQDIPGYAAAAAAVPGVLRRAGDRLRSRPLDRGRRGAHTERGLLPGRDLARLYRSSAARPMGSRRRAGAEIPRPPARRDPAAGAEDRRAAHGRLPGAGHQGHVAGGHHRFHRADPRGPDREQRHVRAHGGVFHRGGLVFPAVLAAVAAGGQDGTASGDCPGARIGGQGSGVRPAPFQRQQAPGPTTSRRRTMFKNHTLRGMLGGALLAACTTLALGMAPAASAETIDQVKQKGELTVGMLVDFPPYGIMNTENQPDGYDADVAKLLAKDLGVKVKIVPVTGPNRIPYLLPDKVDVLVASLAITPERAKQVQFSHPYSAAQIVVFGGKDLKISGPEGLSGKRIGVARASTQDIAVSKIAPKDADVRRFDDDASAMQALLSGQVDAIGCSTTVAAGIAKRAPDRF